MIAELKYNKKEFVGYPRKNQRELLYINVKRQLDNFSYLPLRDKIHVLGIIQRKVKEEDKK